MTGIGPQDALEGLLAAQMVSAHNQAMKCLLPANREGEPRDGRKLYMSFADRFMRTFVAQMEALSRYRKGGPQKVVFEHVHVYPGGQAMVGNVNQPESEGGRETEKQPHAPAASSFTKQATPAHLQQVRRVDEDRHDAGLPSMPVARVQDGVKEALRLHGSGSPVATSVDRGRSPESLWKARSWCR
jgi:hypothetical protein